MSLEVGWQDTHFTRSPGESARPGTKLPGNCRISKFPGKLQKTAWKTPWKLPDFSDVRRFLFALGAVYPEVLFSKPSGDIDGRHSAHPLGEF